MLCEMCGKESPVTKPMMVDKTRLNLCPNCAKFGEGYVTSSAPGANVSQSVIEQRLQKREKRMQTKDVYSSGSTQELIDDYGGAIRSARSEKGMTLDQFADSILEKKGTISKIESNNLIPDDKMISKIEKALGIKLRETVQSGVTVGGGSGRNEGLTLANFIKKV